jgi:hypothetical protein
MKANDMSQIKYYLEGSGPDAGQVGNLLPRVVSELGEQWLEAEKNSLGAPAIPVNSNP